jgi:hypothetical protein
MGLLYFHLSSRLVSFRRKNELPAKINYTYTGRQPAERRTDRQSNKVGNFLERMKIHSSFINQSIFDLKRRSQRRKIMNSLIKM